MGWRVINSRFEQGELIMWQVINKSTGIVVFSSNDRKRCQWFIEDNDHIDGEPAGLYSLVKSEVKYG